MVNKVKFKVSIKELTFEYEGDQEKAQVLQSRITDTLGSLAAAQSDVIDITPSRQLPSAPAMLNHQPARRRRRGNTKSSSKGAGASNVADAGTVGGQVAPKTNRARRPKGEAGRPQVIRLIQEGFFSQKRSTEDVRNELSNKGHNFESNYVSSVLLALTKKDFLKRDDNNEAGNWHYEEGTNKDYAGSRGNS